MRAEDISFIIPVYNRPLELKELLESFTRLKGDRGFEIVIVDDGSSISSKSIVDDFSDELKISYFFKKNSGPGDSRNYGMKQAGGNYFIILDSDCILPESYLEIVLSRLNSDFVDCFGGPDAAHKSFSNLQKAINFTMTSLITTGGIRGHKNAIDNFQPRSFNMGLSKKAFKATKGFGSIHPGEDPDLSIRLNTLNFKTILIPEAYVYHKRRLSWPKFYKQVYKFGMVRQILNQWYPESKRITYWFPALFSLGLIMAIILFILGISWPLLIFALYFIISFVWALKSTKSFAVPFLVLTAIIVQFFGYGYGFIKSWIIMSFSHKEVERQFPNLFFKIDDNDI
jgi:glycosyltransferase involved in cell wall biosynthesis